MSVQERINELLEQYKQDEITVNELLEQLKQLPGVSVIDEEKQYMVSGKVLKGLLNAVRELLLEDST